MIQSELRSALPMPDTQNDVIVAFPGAFSRSSNRMPQKKSDMISMAGGATTND